MNSFSSLVKILRIFSIIYSFKLILSFIQHQLKKEGAGTPYALSVHHKPAYNTEKPTPYGVGSIYMHFALLLEVVIYKAIEQYGLHPRCRCKSTQNNSKIMDYCKITVFCTSFLTFPTTSPL